MPVFKEVYHNISIDDHVKSFRTMIAVFVLIQLSKYPIFMAISSASIVIFVENISRLIFHQIYKIRWLIHLNIEH